MTLRRSLVLLFLVCGSAAAQTPTVQSLSITQTPAQANQAVRLGDLQAALAAAVPQAAPCTLYGGTGSAGTAVAVTLGTGLACANNVVTATGGGGTAGVQSVAGLTGTPTAAQLSTALGLGTAAAQPASAFYAAGNPAGYQTAAQVAAAIPAPPNLAPYALAASLKPVALSGAYADLTGPPAIPTVGTAAGTVAAGNDARITGALQAATAAGIYAPLANPTFTGAVVVPTPSAGDNSTKAASTAFVTAAIAGLSGGSSGGSYTLPQASTTTLGGVKLGSTLTSNPTTGVVDVVTTAPTALSGVVQASDTFVMTRLENGVVVPHTVTGTQMNSFFGNSAGSYATAFTTSLSAASGAQGSPVTFQAVPTTNGWPPSTTLTPSSTLAGSFTPATVTPTAGSATAASFQFTPSGTGSGTITLAASPSITNSTGPLAYTATAPVAAGPTLTMTSPTYATTIYGGGLSGGSGTANLTAITSSSSAWTIEGTAIVTGSPNGPLAFFPGPSGYDGAGLWGPGDGSVAFYMNGNTVGHYTPPAGGALVHYATVTQGSPGNAGHYDVYFWVNGALVGSTTYNAAGGYGGYNNNGVNATSSFVAGAGGGGVATVGEVRVSNVARYTAPFTPPSGPLTKDSSTVGLYEFKNNGAAQ